MKEDHAVKLAQCVFLGFTFRGAKLRWSDVSFEDFSIASGY
jgi:hypothetical protein